MNPPAYLMISPVDNAVTNAINPKIPSIYVRNTESCFCRFISISLAGIIIITLTSFYNKK